MADAEQWFKAVRSKNMQLVSELLPTFARTQTKNGETALMMAAASNCLSLCRTLAPHEHSMTNHKGYTALAIAALRNHSSICLLLVKYEKSVPLHKGMTPLLLAIQSSSLDAVRVLTPYYPDTEASKMSDIAVLIDDSDMLSLLINSASITHEDVQRSLSASTIYTEQVAKSSIEPNTLPPAQSLLLSAPGPVQSEPDEHDDTRSIQSHPFSLSTQIGGTVASTRIEQIPSLQINDSTMARMGVSVVTDQSRLQISHLAKTLSSSTTKEMTTSSLSNPAERTQDRTHTSNPNSVEYLDHTESINSQSGRSTGVILSRSRIPTSPTSSSKNQSKSNTLQSSADRDIEAAHPLSASKPRPDSGKKKKKRNITSAKSTKEQKDPKESKLSVQRLFPSPPRGHPGRSPSLSPSRRQSIPFPQSIPTSPSRSSPSRSSPLKISSKNPFIISSGTTRGSSPRADVQVRPTSALDIRSLTIKNPFSTQRKLDPTFYIAGAEEAPRSSSAIADTSSSRKSMDRYRHRYAVLAEKYSKMREEFDTLRQMGEKVTANVVSNLNEVISTLQTENEEKTAEIDRLQIENQELLWKLDEAEQTLRSTIQTAAASVTNNDVVFPPTWEATAVPENSQSNPIPLPRSMSAPRAHTDSKLEHRDLSEAELDSIIRHLHTQSSLSRAAQIILALKESQQEMHSELIVCKKKLEAAIDARDAEHNECLILKQKLMVLEKDYLDLKASVHVKIQKDNDGNTRLIRAVAFKSCSDAKAIKQLIREEAGAENNRGQTALMYAAALGLEDIGMLLIARESGHQDKIGCSALMIAVKKGLISLAEALIPYEAGLRDKDGETSLMTLTRAGILESLYGAIDSDLASDTAGHCYPSHMYVEQINKLTDVIRVLLSIEGGMKNNEGKTALMLAAEQGRNKILVELISREAKLHDNHYRTALMIACEVNNLEAVHLLVPHEKCILRCDFSTTETSLLGSDFEALAQSITNEDRKRSEPMFGTTALMQMANSGNYSLAQILVLHESGMMSQNGLMALDYAVLSGHKQIIELLNDVEGLVTVQNEFQADKDSLHKGDGPQKTQLMQMVKQRRPGLIYCLLHQAGKQDSHGMTALMHAVLARNHDAIRLLINVEARMKNAKGETALMLAILVEDKTAIDLLAPHEQGIQDNEGTTALMICAYNNYKDLVPLFIEREHGMVMLDGTSALMVAAEQGFEDICTMLRPYELNITKDDGTTAFLLAKRRGHIKIAESLSPKIVVDEEGNTDLMRQIIELGSFDSLTNSAANGYRELVVSGTADAQQLDISRIERINKAWLLKALLYQTKQVNNHGRTALMLATANRNVIAVKLLRKLEAKMTLGTFICRTWKLTDVTALMMAACYGYADIVHLLAKYEARCVESSFHRTALMAAAYFNHVSCVKILLEYEAGMQRREGSTALMLAVSSGYYDIAALLVKLEANITTNAKSTYGEGASALTMAAALNNYQMVELLAPYEAMEFGEMAIKRTSDPSIAELIRAHVPLGRGGIGTV